MNKSNTNNTIKIITYACKKNPSHHRLQKCGSVAEQVFILSNKKLT